MASLTSDKAKGITYIIGAGVGALLIYAIYKGVAGTLASILEKLGVNDSQATKDAAANIDKNTNKVSKEGANNYWNPTFWRKKYGYYLDNASTKNYVISITAQIYSSIGYFYDSPEQLLAAFKKINSKAGVSVVSYLFAQTYGLDLYAYLHSKLDTQSQIQIFNQIITYCDNLPEMA